MSDPSDQLLKPPLPICGLAEPLKLLQLSEEPLFISAITVQI